jgi:hypothetical protein
LKGRKSLSSGGLFVLRTIARCANATIDRIKWPAAANDLKLLQVLET